MRAPKPPLDEASRLAALGDYRILDTDPEGSFDALTKIASQALGVPIALISIVDSSRQWFKSRHGLAAHETHRDVSFCGHVVETGMPLVVGDAQMDADFADNPLVTGEPRVRFYVGMPLRVPSGDVLGTLCVIDHVPRSLSNEQLTMLSLLAQQAVHLLELRKATRLLAETAEAAERRELKLVAMLNQLPAMIGYWDRDLRNRFANLAYLDWFGKAPDQLLGSHIRDLLGEEAYAQSLPFLERALAGEEQRFSRTIETPTGPRHADARYIPHIVNGELRGISVLVSDVTERENALTKARALGLELERVARIDALTELLNRRAATELASREAARATRTGKTLFLALLDVDHFKHVNDSHGHPAGDAVLQHVGRVLGASLRETDICARWGGEEFLVLLSNTDRDGAFNSIERIRENVAQAASDRPSVTLSAGLVEWNPGRQSLDEAISGADVLLYAAKAAGRDQTVSDRPAA